MNFLKQTLTRFIKLLSIKLGRKGKLQANMLDQTEAIQEKMLNLKLFGAMLTAMTKCEPPPPPPKRNSGTTGIACVLEGRDFIGIEREAEYLEIARKRIDYWSQKNKSEMENNGINRDI